MNDKHMEINKKFTGLDVTQKLELFVQEMCMSNLHFGLRLQTHMIGKKKGSAKNICIVEIIKKIHFQLLSPYRKNWWTSNF